MLQFQETGSRLRKEAENILKYKDLTIGIQHMWKVKAKVIPVITEASETISKSSRQCLSKLPGKHTIKEIQTTAILGTAHLLHTVYV